MLLAVHNTLMATLAILTLHVHQTVLSLEAYAVAYCFAK